MLTRDIFHLSDLIRFSYAAIIIFILTAWTHLHAHSVHAILVNMNSAMSS